MWRLEWEEILDRYQGNRRIESKKYTDFKIFKTKRKAMRYVKKWKLGTVTTYTLRKE